MKKNISPFLSFVLGATLLVPHNTHTNDLGDFGRAVAIIGGAAFVAGATIWACSEESDSSLIFRAETIYQDSYALKSIGLTDRRYRDLSYLPEDTVESVCTAILKKNTAHDIKSIVKDQLRSLYGIKSDLNKRIDSLQLKHTFEKRTIIDSMISLKENIANRIDAIEKGIQTFLYYHQEYLELFESEQIVYTRYAKELAVLRERYSSNREKESAIKCLASKKDYTERYPYSAYLSLLKNDIYCFSGLLKKLTRSYPHREKMAYEAKSNLEYIYSIISTSAELERENIQKERDEIERKERELEKRRIEKKRKKLEKLESRHARRYQSKYRSI